MSSETDGTQDRVNRMTEDAEAWLAKTFRKIEKAEGKGDHEKADELRDQIEPYGRSVERVVTLTLAGGGPSHWLEVTLDDDGDVSDVSSVATWGFKEKRTRIYGGSALWRYAEEMTSDFGAIREGE